MKSKKAQAHYNYLKVVLADTERKAVWKRMIDSKAYPLVVTYKVYRRTDARFDYINIVQNLFDAMVKAGYIPDDDARHLIPVPLQYEKDSKNPRTILEVL